ncbi:MAG: adenylyltransferase/cytidyltransferase family protein [Deltaproteobacteria bacterium]|nr:adenylyltransferase/cytidyltransferase family protein [Deltaproteobacteria bacterium]
MTSSSPPFHVFQAPAPPPADMPGALALFGGTFNPFHIGHLAVINALTLRPDVSGVVVIPAACSPFKTGQTFLPASLRLALTAAALMGRERVWVDPLEIQQPPPSYTLHTLRAYRQRHPQALLWWVMGSDALEGFARWKGAEEILSLAGLLIAPRLEETGPQPEPPARWGDKLPPPWNEQARFIEGRWQTEEGRVLAEPLQARPPAVSSTRLLAERRLDWVPPGAREQLARHWAESTNPVDGGGQ